MKIFRDNQHKLERTQDAIIQSLVPGKQLLIATVAKWNACSGGGFFAITALSPTVVDVSGSTTGIVENLAGTISPATTDFDIATGVTIYGQFSKITLVSGSVIAYAKPHAILTGEA